LTTPRSKRWSAAQSGRTLLLVIGRELDDVERVAPRLDAFERVVAENGGLLYGPAYRDSVPLADPPPERLVSGCASATSRRSGSAR
jgi:hydroxymethylpyrimidine pyrophosphatase-like HAD family hydrolase